MDNLYCHFFIMKYVNTSVPVPGTVYRLNIKLKVKAFHIEPTTSLAKILLVVYISSYAGCSSVFCVARFVLARFLYHTLFRKLVRFVLRSSGWEGKLKLSQSLKKTNSYLHFTV